MQEPQNERKSVIMNLLSMLIFGTIGIFRRHIPVSSAFLSFSRGLLGGIFILIFMMLFHRTSKDIIKVHTIIGLVVTGALMGVNWMLLFEAFNHTTVAVAILSYIDPVSALLFSAFFLKEPLNTLGIIGAIMIIGSAVLSEMFSKKG